MPSHKTKERYMTSTAKATTLRKTSKLATCEKHAGYYANFTGARKWSAVVEGGAGSESPCEGGTCVLTPGTDHYSDDFVTEGAQTVAAINGHELADVLPLMVGETDAASREAAVLAAAAEVFELALVPPSEMAGESANLAVRLDREIRAGFAVVLESKARLLTMVEEAKGAEIHKLLTNPETGKAYRSWTDYIGGVIAGLDVDFKGMGARDKAFLVVLLYNTGMSQKVIAKALNIGVATVNRAIQAGRESGNVDKDRKTVAADGREFSDTEGEDAATPKPKAEEKPIEKAVGHVKSLSALVGDMDADQLQALKGALSTLGREVTAAAKAL
jgi:hypothetical protein